MSRAPYRFDRVATALAGLLLIVTGVALIDWKQHIVRHDYPHRLDLQTLVRWEHAGWWPWATSAAGIVLVLAGLWWLLAHARRARIPTLALPAVQDSTGNGTLTLDTATLEHALTQDLIGHGPVTAARAKTLRDRHGLVVQIAATLDEGATGTAVASCDQRLDEQMSQAFPGSGLRARLVLNAPRPPRRGRTGPSTNRGAITPRKDTTMGLADKAKNAAQDVAGKAKEALGDATNNDNLKSDGQTDQTKASAKKAGEDIKDVFTKD